MAKRSPRPSHAAASVPWHPSVDALEPMADAVEALIKAPVVDLPEDVRFGSTRPSSRLANELNLPGMGRGTRSASRREMVRRWLQTNGFDSDSRELEQRLTELLDRLRAWEDQARRQVESREPECQLRESRGEHVELVDRLGEETCAAFDEVIGLAANLADYMRQLSAMVRAKISRSLGASGKITVIGEADNPPSQLVWLATAMLLVQDHPEWSDRKIAGKVGRHPSQLSRSAAYQEAAKLARGSKADIKSGYLTRDPETGMSDIEAYDDDLDSLD
ncbi:MAG: hypothetical protein ACF8PN_01640 [Phycisphaerales bacterium]